MDLPFRLGRFELTRKLGAGGMGAVYYGTAGSTPAAVKIIRADLAGDVEFRARFRREIRLVRRVSGACTARVLDADPDGDPPYLATEYLAGPSLGEYVRAHGPMSADVVFALAVGLAEALVAIHDAGVVHRDLKPENVLLTRDGPKVVDFGIAYAADATSITYAGSAIGTPAYMSPEQISGVNTPVTDVFAWAGTVVFAATGHAPFGQGPRDALLFRIRHDPPDLTGVPPVLRQLLTRAFAKDPMRRPDARELLRRMLAVAGGEDAAEVAGAGDLGETVTQIIAASWPIRADLPPPSPAAATAESPTVGSPTSRTPESAAPTGSAARAPRRRRLHRRLSVLAAAVAAVAAIVIAQAVTLAHGNVQGSGDRPVPASATRTAAQAVGGPASPRPGGGADGPTPAVTADRLPRGVRLYEEALDGNFKVWSFHVGDLTYGATSGPAFQAPILGAWWSLADWCVANHRGAVGECHDLAASYVEFWFHYDPRRINTETWTGAGAIAGSVFDGYNATQADLGLPPNNGTVDGLFPGRPGYDGVLCEPSCAARLDRHG